MNILIVDDDHNSRKAMAKFLRQIGHMTTECNNAQNALIEYAAKDYQMVLSDIRMPGGSGLELLKNLSTLPDRQKCEVVLFTGYADTDSAVEALRAGAYDYLFKPVNAEELAAIVEKIAQRQAFIRDSQQIVEVGGSKQENTICELDQLSTAEYPCQANNIGVFSTYARQVVDMALKYHMDRSLPILIEGPTGTGKEVIAKLIHFGSGQHVNASKPFVDINCANISHNLFESELFGYEPNTFTGSSKYGQKGKVDVANGGTLFLDELEALPFDLQGKLLRFIQEREYYRIGGLKKIKVDVRIICATNVELEKKIKEGSFRSDLYYRLKVGHLVLRPLCERREEIIPLALMFLKEFSLKKRKHFKYINEKAAAILLSYRWPGNIREMRNLLEWVVFMYDDVELKPEHLTSLSQEPSIISSEDDSTIKTIRLDLMDDEFSLEEVKRIVICETLEMCQGNKSAAARHLGISRRTLLNYLQKIEDE